MIRPFMFTFAAIVTFFLVSTEALEAQKDKSKEALPATGLTIGGPGRVDDLPGEDQVGLMSFFSNATVCATITNLTDSRVSLEITTADTGNFLRQFIDPHLTASLCAPVGEAGSIDNVRAVCLAPGPCSFLWRVDLGPPLP